MASKIYYTKEGGVRFKKRKARFTFSEVHIMLDEVKKHRHILVGGKSNYLFFLTNFLCSFDLVSLWLLMKSLNCAAGYLIELPTLSTNTYLSQRT